MPAALKPEAREPLSPSFANLLLRFLSQVSSSFCTPARFFLIFARVFGAVVFFPRFFAAYFGDSVA